MEKSFDKRSFARSVWLLALPIFINALIDSAVDLADTFMLGYVGQNELSAAVLAGNTIHIANNFYFGLCTGAGILIAQYWGKKDGSAIQKAFGIALRVSLAAGALLSGVSIFMPVTIMRLFTNDATLIQTGAEYLRIVGICNLLNSYSRVYLAAQRSMERAVIGTVANTVALLTNCALNACFIFGFGPIPKLGIRGVALATVIARVIELVICMADSIAPARTVRIGFQDLFKRDRLLLGDFARFTLPALGNDLVWSLGVSMCSAIIGRTGAEIVAANAYATTLRTLSAIHVSAVCGAAGVIVGKTLGEGRLSDARVFGSRFLKLSMWAGLVSAVILLIAVPMIRLIPGITVEASDCLRFMLFYSMPVMFSQSVNRMMLDAVLRAGGDTLYGFKLGLVITWAFCALGGFLLMRFTNASAFLIYAWLYLDEILKVPCVIVRFRRGKWVKNLTRAS